MYHPCGAKRFRLLHLISIIMGMILIDLEGDRTMDSSKKNRQPTSGGPSALDELEVEMQGLQLSAIREEEIEQLLPLFNDPDAAGFYVPAMIRPYNLEQLKGLMGDWNDRAESYVFAIRKEGRLVGIANVDGFSWANAHAEIGIALASPAFRGQGIAAAALHLLLRYLFVDVGLHRVFCRIMEGNEASIRLFSKAGFRPEGRMKEHVRRHGKYIDMLMFGLLADEWEKARTERP